MFKQDEEISKILLETISEAVIIFDKRLIIMEVNSSAEKVFGYSKEELISRNLSVLLPTKYHEDLNIRFEDFFKTKKGRKTKEATSVIGLKKDETLIQLEVKLIPFSIFNNNYAMAILNDISDKKAIEKKLMIKGRALESAKNGIIITDALKPDNPVIYFNAAFKNLTDYDDHEILNHNCRFLHGTDRNQEPLERIREAIKNGESCQAILRNYKKDGTLFWNDLYIMPILDDFGVVTNFIGIQNDITEKKIKEEQVQHLSSIFDKSLNEIHVFDAITLKYINVNYGGQKNLGYTMEELVTMTPIDITPYKTEKELRAIIDVLLHGNFEKLVVETLHQRKDGSTYPVETHLQLSKLGQREVFVAIILDITERKNYTTKLEKIVKERTQQLEEALNKEIEVIQLKNKFISSLSYEFKTPLSAILTSALLLSKYNLTEQQEKRNKHVKTITDKAQLLNNILNSFLSLEKFDAGKLNYQFKNFKISAIVDEVIFNSRMLIKKGQQIKYTERAEDLSLYQDEKVIELILSNLIHNAIKYSPENTTIFLDIEQNEETTIFKIQDMGIGIPEKDQKNIFERYYRAENVTDTEGTGIGLNIVKNHLEKLNGTINFESKEDSGTTFTVTIPNIASS